MIVIWSCESNQLPTRNTQKRTIFGFFSSNHPIPTNPRRQQRILTVDCSLYCVSLILAIVEIFCGSFFVSIQEHVTLLSHNSVRCGRVHRVGRVEPNVSPFCLEINSPSEAFFG